MNTILSFLTSLLVFLHIITPVSAPITTPLPLATPIVSQQTVKKPVVTSTDSREVLKCKLEASLAVDKLSDVFIQSSESKLVNNPLYRQQQLIQKAKLQKLTVFEIEVFTSGYDKGIVDRRDPAELDAFLKIVTNQLINSQKELRDNFTQLTTQQYNLVYLQCVNR